MHKLLYSRKSLLMIMFGETVWTKIITKKFDEWIDQLLIVTTNLVSFSLANNWSFAKFAKLSPANLSHYMVFNVFLEINMMRVT